MEERVFIFRFPGRAARWKNPATIKRKITQLTRKIKSGSLQLKTINSKNVTLVYKGIASGLERHVSITIHNNSNLIEIHDHQGDLTEPQARQQAVITLNMLFPRTWKHKIQAKELQLIKAPEDSTNRIECVGPSLLGFEPIGHEAWTPEPAFIFSDGKHGLCKTCFSELQLLFQALS